MIVIVPKVSFVMWDLKPEHRDYLTVHNQFHFPLVTLNYINYHNILLASYLLKDVDFDVNLSIVVFDNIGASFILCIHQLVYELET
jgi:hypothetical protein